MAMLKTTYATASISELLPKWEAGDSSRDLDPPPAPAHELRKCFLASPPLVQHVPDQDAASSVTFTSGMRLGRFEIQSLLGFGGMGRVYRAHDTLFNRTVAIKVICARLFSDHISRRFQLEARAISALQHPNICALQEAGQQHGIKYLVMEYLEGETLAVRLAKGCLPLDQTLRYGIEVADALFAAHRRGIVHRDLKPRNILLTNHGECKVLDWQSWRRSLRDERTDIFSLGILLYEMATGTFPFSGHSSAEIKAPASPTTLNPRLPKQLDRIIGKALDEDRNLTYQSVSDLRTDLERLSNRV